MELLGDFALVWSAIFGVDAVRYFVGVGIVAWLLYRKWGHWSQSRRIQSRRAERTDVRREVAYSVLTAAVFAAVGAGLHVAYDQGLLPRVWRPHRYGWAWSLASLPILLVLHDAYFYWVHRALHHRWLFRHVHRVHHLSRTPSSWAAYAFAPGEALLMALFIPIASTLMPVQQGVLFFFMLIMVLRNGMGHSGIEYHPRWWIDSPLDHLTTTTHHDLHHQRVRGNYGLYFTWWDRWMRTELPDYRERFLEAAGGARVAPEAEALAAPPASRASTV